MPIDKFLAVFPGVFIKPAQTWLVLKSDTTQTIKFFWVLGLPFILAGAFGRALSDQNIEKFVDSPFLLLFLIHFLAHLLTLCGGSWMIARLAGSYSLRPGFERVFKLSLTAYIPFLLSQLFTGFVWLLHWLPFAGLVFSVFLFWNGSGNVLQIPRNRLAGFTLLSFFVFLGIGFLGLYLFRMIIFAPVTQN